MPPKDLFGLARRLLRYRSLHSARLIQANMPFQPAPLRPEGGMIRCDEIDLSIDPLREAFFVEGLRYAYPTVKSGDGRFERNSEGQLEFSLGTVRIVPETVDDLAVLNEVFARQIYRLIAIEPYFVVDVGLNIGAAALYFAGILGWDVLGFEPFPITFEAALRNVERSELGDRIHVQNAGLSDASGRTVAQYDHATRGSNGIAGNFHAGRTGSGEPVEIELVDAAAAFEEAFRLAQGRPLLAKIDCEGTEYDILDRLGETGLLKRVAVCVVEYHTFLPGQDPERLVVRFQEAGFVIQQLWSDGPVGGLFAIRPS